VEARTQFEPVGESAARSKVSRTHDCAIFIVFDCKSDAAILTFFEVL